jgi:hypothetical protein
MKLFLLVLVEYGIDCRVARLQYAIALDVGARYRVERGAGCVSDDLDEMFFELSSASKGDLSSIDWILAVGCRAEYEGGAPWVSEDIFNDDVFMRTARGLHSLVV